MRRSNKNIGILKEDIMNETGLLLDNTQHWINNKTFPFEELAVRFHHRLVQIHIFPNGNGRHARLMTDILIKKLGLAKLTWGAGGATTSLEVEGTTRSTYIMALKAADKNNFKLLTDFVRS